MEIKKMITIGRNNAIRNRDETDPEQYPSLRGFHDGKVEAYNIVLELLETRIEETANPVTLLLSKTVGKLKQFRQRLNRPNRDMMGFLDEELKELDTIIAEAQAKK